MKITPILFNSLPSQKHKKTTKTDTKPPALTEEQQAAHRKKLEEDNAKATGK